MHNRILRLAATAALIATATTACGADRSPSSPSNVSPSVAARPAADSPAWCSTLAGDADVLALTVDVPALVDPTGNAKTRVLAAAAALNAAADQAGSEVATAMRATSGALSTAADDPNSTNLTAAGDALTQLGQQVQNECHYS